MTRQQKDHVLAKQVTVRTNNETPKHLSKQEFARRLYARMVSKELIQADLAKKTGLSRNNISTYVRGQCYPTHRSLELLARALDCTIDDLLPNVREAAIRGEVQPEMSFKVSVADPSRAWLTVNQLVTTSVALEVLAILNKDRSAST